MKIVHVVNHFLPDYGYQEHFLAKAMAALGHEVHVITSNRAYPDHGVYKIFAERYPDRVLPVRTYSRAGYTVHMLRAALEKNLQLVLRGLFGKIREIQPDLVIMHNLSRYETMRLAAYHRFFRPKWRLIVDDHTLFEFHEPKLYRRVYYALLRFFYGTLGMHKGIDQFVPVADECASFLQKVFRLPAEKMKVVPLGVDCELFRFSAEGREEIRKSLRLEADSFLLSYIGKIVPERGLHEMLDWLCPLLKAEPKLQLLILGAGLNSEYGRSLQEFTSREGIASKVHFLPGVTQDQLPRYFSAADAAIWPKQETIAAHEAAACRLPLILSNNPISRERTAGGNGFNCASPEEYRQAVSKLLRDSSYRKELADKGETYIRQHYSWDRLAKQFLSV